LEDLAPAPARFLEVSVHGSRVAAMAARKHTRTRPQNRGSVAPVVGVAGMVVFALVLALVAPFGAPAPVRASFWTLLELGIGLLVAGVAATIACSPLNR